MEIEQLLKQLPDSVRHNGVQYFLSFFRASGTWYVEYKSTANRARYEPTLVYVEHRDFATALKELAQKLRERGLLEQPTIFA